MKRSAAILLFTAATMAAAPASAATKSFTVLAPDLFPFGDAVPQFVGAGIELPDQAYGAAGITFRLPKDYKPDSPVKVRVQMFSSGTACNLAITGAGAVRTRTGTVPEITDGFTMDSLTPITTLSVPFVFSKPFTLKKPTNALNNNLKPGDIIVAYVQREGQLAEDTCNGEPAVITSAKVTYTTK